MSGITITVDTSAVRQAITDLGTRTMPYIIKRALNDTGEDLLKAERESMENVFDRPTPWVLNSFFIEEAKESNLTLELRPKEGGGSRTVPGYKSLWAEIFGGTRKPKSHELALRRAGIMRADEFAVPGAGVSLDTYGNVSGKYLSTVLSQLSASPDPMQNVTKRSRARSGKRRIYFLMRGKSVHDGVYQRLAGRRIVPILIFVRSPGYDQRFPYRETAERVVNSNFFMHLHERFQRYGTQLGGASAANLGG